MNVIDILLRQKPLIKVLIIVVILAAILGTYWQVFYKPVLTDIRTLEPELNQLKSELAAKKVIVKEKARYLAELEQTRAKLYIALKQLPDKRHCWKMSPPWAQLLGCSSSFSGPCPRLPKTFLLRSPWLSRLRGSIVT